MAVNKLENFNRIIDITFIGPASKDGSELRKNERSIICPRHGRKPEIEINGTMGASYALMALHITIKNLYVDYRTEQYSKIRIRAGYENNYKTFEANIVFMYPDRPGPESTTIIECTCGNVMPQWLDATVNIEFETGTKIQDVLESIKAKLGVTELVMGDHAKTLSLKEPFYFNGTAREVLERLNQRFADDKLQCFMQQSRICAICLETEDHISIRQVKYLSAPLNFKQGGGEYGVNHQTVTAPWMPDLLPGDLLEIPAVVFRANNTMIGSKNLTNKQRMQVWQISFHFGTCGTVNQMVCECSTGASK